MMMVPPLCGGDDMELCSSLEGLWIINIKFLYNKELNLQVMHEEAVLILHLIASGPGLHNYISTLTCHTTSHITLDAWLQ